MTPNFTQKPILTRCPLYLKRFIPERKISRKIKFLCDLEHNQPFSELTTNAQQSIFSKLESVNTIIFNAKCVNGASHQIKYLPFADGFSRW